MEYTHSKMDLCISLVTYSISFSGNLHCYHWPMTSIVLRIVVFFVNRVSGDSSVSWAPVSGRNLRRKLVMEQQEKCPQVDS